MNKIALVVALLWCVVVKAQSPLTDYSIASKINEECATVVTLPLFPPQTNLHHLNVQIVEELTKHHFLFQKQLVNLESFYKQSMFTGDSMLGFTLLAGCTFRKNGLYSFTGCPYNACDKRPQSEMETVMTVLDSTLGKTLVLKDIVEPGKYDSLVKFVVWVANRYKLRNLPSCSFESVSPVSVKSSSNTSSATNQVTYFNQLDSRFYLKYNFFQVYLMAEHSAYVYNCVEIPLPIQMMKYFLKPAYAKRIYD